jgi:hypothetical protein
MHSLRVTVYDEWSTQRKVYVLSCLSCDKHKTVKIDMEDLIDFDVSDVIHNIYNQATTWNQYHPGVEELLTHVAKTDRMFQWNNSN